MRTDITACPGCGRPLQVTELTCPECDLRLHGHFQQGCAFCALDPEQRHLLGVFLSCRGVVRDMEKALGLSYPTVRARVDGLLAALGYGPAKSEPEPEGSEDSASRRREILDQLEAGTLSPDEAAAALRAVAEGPPSG
jgi:hypothetical protein